MKNTKLNVIILCLSLLVGLNRATAQDKIIGPGGEESPIKLGIYGGILYNMHSGSFVTTDGRFSCCEFDEGDGIKPTFGLKAFIPVYEEIDFSPRLAYSNLGGKFEKVQNGLPILGQNNRVEYLFFNDKMDVQLHSIAIDLPFVYNIQSINTYIGLGPGIDFIVSKNFKKTETPNAPPGVTYVGGATSKVVYDGDMDIVNKTLVSLKIPVGCFINIDETYSINPELMYAYTFNKVSKENDWKMSNFAFTLAFIMNL